MNWSTRGATGLAALTMNGKALLALTRPGL